MSTAVEVTLKLGRSHATAYILTSLAVLVASFVLHNSLKRREAITKGYPTALEGFPIVGHALDFQKDPKALIDQGFAKYRQLPSKCFGLHLASLTHYVLSQPEDLRMMLEDNPYEMRFNLTRFFEAINMPVILRKANFDTNLHTNLIRTHLTDPATVARIGKTMQSAAERFISDYPLVPPGKDSQNYAALTEYVDRYITSVSARCMVGSDAYNHPELIDMFLNFNTEVDKVMGLGMMMPAFLRSTTDLLISRSYNRFRKIFLPIIKKRRLDFSAGQDGLLDFMPFILEVVDDDERASDLVAITVWIGLRNLQITVASTLLDIINVPGLSDEIEASLSGANVENLNTFGPDAGRFSPWMRLRSSMFESIRLCGPVTGPARIISSPHPLQLASDPSVRLPPKQVATLSSYYSHRQEFNYENAKTFQADRFIQHDPEIGGVRFITWGLQGPHTCPGRWFTQEAICIMVRALLMNYRFEPAKTLQDEEKYIYHAGVVTRKEVDVKVTRR